MRTLTGISGTGILTLISSAQPMKRWFMFALVMALALCGCDDDVSFDNITARIGDHTLDITRAVASTDTSRTVDLWVAEASACDGHSPADTVYVYFDIPDLSVVPIGSSMDVSDAPPFSVELGAVRGCETISETIAGTVLFNSLSAESASGSIDLSGSGNTRSGKWWCNDAMPIVFKWDGFETLFDHDNEPCDN